MAMKRVDPMLSTQVIKDRQHGKGPVYRDDAGVHCQWNLMVPGVTYEIESANRTQILMYRINPDDNILETTTKKNRLFVGGLELQNGS